MRALSRPLFASLLLLVSGTLAQAPSSSPTTCLKHTIVATVLDRDGNPVIDLDKTNFELESKPSLKIAKVERPNHLPRIILVADVSTTRSGPQNMAVVGALAGGFLRAAPADARLAMLTFGGQKTDRFDFSAPKEVIAHTIDEISGGAARLSGKGRPLFDSLADAIKMFGTPLPGDSIFLIISGPNFQSQTDLPSVKKLLLQSGVRVFLIGLFYIPPNFEAIGRDEVLGLSRDTGGVSVEPISLIGHWTPHGRVEDGHWDVPIQGMADAELIGRHMYTLVASGYQIEIETNHSSDVPVKLKVKVVAGDGKRLSKARVAYPYELLPCGETEMAK